MSLIPGPGPEYRSAGVNSHDDPTETDAVGCNKLGMRDSEEFRCENTQHQPSQNPVTEACGSYPQNIARNLADKPKVRLPPSPERTNRVTVDFDQISGCHFCILRGQDAAQQSIRPPRRVKRVFRAVYFRCHANPFKGNGMPRQISFTAALASLRACTPSGSSR